MLGTQTLTLRGGAGSPPLDCDLQEGVGPEHKGWDSLQSGGDRADQVS